MSLLKQISQSGGAPSLVRIGTVVSTNPLQVTVQGTTFSDVGVIGALSMAPGDTVALLGQSNSVSPDATSWLCLGTVFPGDPGILPIATLRQTVAQSLPNNTSTAIDFDVADIDTAGGWNAALPSRYTSMMPGRSVYQCSGGIGFAGNAAGVRTVQFRVNAGADMAGTGVSAPGTAAVTQRMASRTSHVILDEGSFVQITGFQNTGGALNTVVTGVEQSTLEVRYVGSL